jgi:hypothetical protein
MTTKHVRIFSINRKYLYYKEHSVFMKITEVFLLATAKEKKKAKGGCNVSPHIPLAGGNHIFLATRTIQIVVLWAATHCNSVGKS